MQVIELQRISSTKTGNIGKHTQHFSSLQSFVCVLQNKTLRLVKPHHLLLVWHVTEATCKAQAASAIFHNLDAWWSANLLGWNRNRHRRFLLFSNQMMMIIISIFVMVISHGNGSLIMFDSTFQQNQISHVPSYLQWSEALDHEVNANQSLAWIEVCVAEQLMIDQKTPNTWYIYIYIMFFFSQHLQPPKNHWKAGFWILRPISLEKHRWQTWCSHFSKPSHAALTLAKSPDDQKSHRSWRSSAILESNLDPSWISVSCSESTARAYKICV